MTADTFTGSRIGRTCSVMFDGHMFENHEEVIRFGEREEFAWGTFRIGTLKLAFAMLAHAFGQEVAIAHFHDMARHLAEITTNDFTLTKDQLREMLTMRVSTFHTHIGDSGAEDSFVYRRGAADIRRAAEAAFAEVLAGPAVAGADALPEVAAYLAIREKNDGIEAAMQKIDLDLRQIDLDRERAAANLDGAKLAKKLTDLDANRQALTAQIGDVQLGGELFARDVQRARAAAVASLEQHLVAARDAIAEIAKNRLSTANAALRESNALFGLMDDAAVARHVSHLSKMLPGLREQVFAVIAEPAE